MSPSTGAEEAETRGSSHGLLTLPGTDGALVGFPGPSSRPTRKAIARPPQDPGRSRCHRRPQLVGQFQLPGRRGGAQNGKTVLSEALLRGMMEAKVVFGHQWQVLTCSEVLRSGVD